VPLAKPEASYLTKHLSNSMIDSCGIFYDQASYRKWKGFRILGIDGSTLQLPHHESIIDMFGQHSFGPKADALKSMARISYLYEVYNGLVIDAQMEGFSTSETALCWGHLSHCKPGDLLLFDRYYASHQLIFSLLQKGVGFCFPMKEDWWNVVEEFSNSKKMEDIVMLDLPKNITSSILICPPCNGWFTQEAQQNW
jgi:hypothetical protein